MKGREIRHPGRAPPFLPPETRAWLLGCSPAAPFLLVSSPCFHLCKKSVQFSPGRFSHFFFLPVSKQALGEHHRSMTACLQGEGFHFSSLLVPRSMGTGRKRTAMGGGTASCTVLPLPPHPSLVKKAELQTQILQKISHKTKRPGPVLEKAKLHETQPSFCLLASPGLASSLRKCTKLLGDDKHLD